MANLTVDTTRRSRTRDYQSYKVADAVQLYAGSFVALGTGYARKWADTAGFTFRGIATRQALGATSSTPIPEVSVDESGPVLDQVAVTGVSAVTDIGAKVYATDDNVMTLTPTTNVKAIGEVVRWYSSTTCDVKIYTPQEYENQGTVSDITALTDSSGGAAANDTIGAVTAPTALTDNGGGTADGTVASQAAPVTLTDSTGLSGSHDDTLAAVTTFTPSVAWNGSSVYPSAADATAIATAITVLNQNASDSAQKIIELVTLAGTARDNLKELTARQAENRTAIVALTDAVTELATKVNEIIADLNQQ